MQSQVARILFDEGKRAVGVEFRPNPRFHPEDAGAPIRTVKAKKLVVLSAGACGTPAILERSGVGDPKVLQKVGLPVVHDLPGVGNGYEDHHLVSKLCCSTCCIFIGMVSFAPSLASQNNAKLTISAVNRLRTLTSITWVLMILSTA